MAHLPAKIRQAWKELEGPPVLATVDAQGAPNIIYATCINFFGDDRMVVADNYFKKTRQNLLTGGRKGAILFICKDGKAYQIKGSLEYHTKGEIFDHMKTWNPVKHPGHAVAVLCVEECYCGGERVE